jgi:hypothetical protein
LLSLSFFLSNDAYRTMVSFFLFILKQAFYLQVKG